MSNIYSLVAKGGVVMIPIVGLSILTIGRAIERSWFWYQLLRSEDRIVHDVLEAAHHDLELAAAIARKSSDLPIGRFLLAPLRLKNPTPETFRLALETAADKEFIEMQKGQIIFKEKPIAETELAQQMQEYLTKNPQGAVLLKADRKVPYEQLAKLLGTMQKVGGERVSLAIETN